jgi:hypothetical protein
MKFDLKNHHIRRKMKPQAQARLVLELQSLRIPSCIRLFYFWVLAMINVFYRYYSQPFAFFWDFPFLV